MATILIDGNPFEFEERPWVGQGKIFDRENAKYALSTLRDTLAENGTKFLLNFGTLLGAVREHYFIGHDNDIDVAIYEKELPLFLRAIPKLYDKGVKLCRFHDGIIYSFIYKDVLIDVDVYLTTQFPYKYRYWKLVNKYFPKFYVEESEKIEFIGELFDVPKNPERFVEYMYGKNWRIPQKGRHARLFPYWMIHIHVWRFIKRCWSYFYRHFLQKLF